MYQLTAPRFRENHSDIKIVDPQSCAKLKTNVASTNNYSLSAFLSFNCFNQFVGIINLSEIEDILRVSTFYSKISQSENLQRKENELLSSYQRICQKLADGRNARISVFTVEPVAIMRV